ncbi:MAG: Gldg family protein [Bdellovibrionota bacterium]
MSVAKIGYWLFIGALFGNVVIWAFVPALGIYGASYLVLLGLALVGLALWVFFSLDRLVNWLKLRSTQFGLSLAVMAVMTFVILGVVNWVAVSKNFKKDLTSNKLHTLSDQTQTIVKGLKEEVRVRIWTTDIARMSEGVDMRGFFENYREIAGEKLKIEIRNPNEFSAEAEGDKIRRNNVIVVKAMTSGREARIENFSDAKGEEQLTNAIIQATKGRKKVVCFVSGHGQPALESTEPQGLSTLKESLEKSNYESRDVNLLNSEKIPAECELIANVGPRKAPVDKEKLMLKNYLAAGGSMIALVGPRASKEWHDAFKDYGVEIRQDLVIDPFRPDNPIFVGTTNYARDVSVTEGFRLNTVFPEASSIHVPTEASPDTSLSIRTFVSSEARTYSKVGEIAQIRNIRPGPGDLHGPLPIAVLIEKTISNEVETSPSKPLKVAPKPKSDGALNRIVEGIVPSAYAQEGDVPDPMGETPPADAAPKKAERVILFSNDLFVVNGVIANGGNNDLFMNSVSYLLQDSELIGIRPRDLRQTFLKLTNQNLRQVWGFILIVAGLFIVFGIKAARRKAVLA